MQLGPNVVLTCAIEQNCDMLHSKHKENIQPYIFLLAVIRYYTLLNLDTYIPHSEEFSVGTTSPQGSKDISFECYEVDSYEQSLGGSI